MKTIQRIVFVALAGMLAVSCATFDDDYGDSSWYGEYPWQDHIEGAMTAVIMLQFRDGGQRCVVTEGIIGAIGFSAEMYDVQWSARDSFRLMQMTEGQTIEFYAGRIRGKKMVLEAMKKYAGHEGTYELKKTD